MTEYIVTPYSEEDGIISGRIVRCRDCKHYSDSEWIIATDVEHVCHFWHGEPTKVEPNGFCAWGVPRESPDPSCDECGMRCIEKYEAGCPREER